MKNNNLYIKKSVVISKLKTQLTCWSILSIVFLISSCSSIEVDPPSFLVSDAVVYNDDASAESSIIGIYSELIASSNFASGNNGSITYISGLYADELNFLGFSSDDSQFANNIIISTNGKIKSFWDTAYNVIYATNAVLEGLEASSGVAEETKSRLTGEAKFIRAFSYFYLTNFFGDVPIVTTTDFITNSLIEQSTPNKIYDLIIKDLTDAKQLLPSNYAMYSNERIRATTGAASALLAKVYLYTEQWALAETEASISINNSGLYSLKSDLNTVFLKNSSEAIWQLQPVIPGRNTYEGDIYNLSGITNPPSTITLSSELATAFTVNDNRKNDWVGKKTIGTDTFYFPYKYKIRFDINVTEYSMVFRLAEQYLIRAEARAMLSNINGAQEDLNTIRNRAGLPNTSANDSNSLIEAVLEERRFELFVEWGHRWLDLKRLGKASEVLGPIKTEWQDTDILFPIPQSDLNNNPNLNQNAGY
jgi:hypothetical protein